MHEFKWESIYKQKSKNVGTKTGKAKVPGGWLILNVTVVSDEVGHSMSESMQFIPDPAHKWEVENVE